MKKKTATSLFVFCALFIAWEIVSRTNPRLIFILPPPSLIFATLIECHERLFFHAWVTMKEMGAGFLLALCASFPLAWSMMRFETSRALLQPFFIVIQCLPMFTLAPIMVVWFGWSFVSIVIPTALMIFFPLTLNIYQGLKSTPKEFLDFFKVNQANQWQTFFKLRLPWAMPHIFSGLKISSAISGIGAIAGEWAGGQKGLGILMLESRRNVDLETTFAALFLLTIMSALFYGLILFAEKLTLSKEHKTLAFSRRKAWAYKAALPLLILSFFSFFGCEKQGKHTRLLLDWLPNPNHVPLYVGVQKGFFKEEGIHLLIQKMPDKGGGITFLTSHQTDLLVNHMPGVLRATSRGAKLKVVGSLIKQPLICLIYNKNENIKTPADLSGKAIGYCVGGSDTAPLDFLLTQGNIAPKKKINVGIDFLYALTTKKVDFIYGGYWNIEPSQLKSLGIEPGFFTITSFGVPPYSELIVLANQDTKESDPQFIQSFKTALQKSINFCKEHPRESFAIYQKHHPDKRDKTLAWEKEAWEITYPILAKDQNIDFQELEKFTSFLKERAIFSQDIDIKSLF